MATVDHDEGGLLRRDAGGCLGSSRQAGIFNADQGSQFTGAGFTAVLAYNGVAISMDGKVAWRENVLVDRLCRSNRHEQMYLWAYDTVTDAQLDRPIS